MDALDTDFQKLGGSFACVNRIWQYFSTQTSVDEAFANFLEKYSSFEAGDSQVDISYGVDSRGERFSFKIDRNHPEGVKFYIEFDGKYHRIIQIPCVEDDKTAQNFE